MILEYSEISEAISLQPLHPIDEISHRVVSRYTEAICELGQAAMATHVMMTSFAFIFGLLPLLIAQGADALSRCAVGTPVFGGMIAAALVGIFVIPMFFVVFQWLRERTVRRVGDRELRIGTE